MQQRFWKLNDRQHSTVTPTGRDHMRGVSRSNKGGLDIRVEETWEGQGGEAAGIRRTVPERRMLQQELHLSP